MNFKRSELVRNIRIYFILLIYFFCGISSNIFSYSSGSWFGFTCGPVGAGASGAIFGLLGAYASYLIVNKNVLGKQG